MKNKIIKYTKFIISVALILSLIAPSYASLSASDGSAFVTKAEFDSALADFNSRLTTFEAGINSKIDSQVTSYLDRNGIWNGKAQTLLTNNFKCQPTLTKTTSKSIRSVLFKKDGTLEQQVVDAYGSAYLPTDSDFGVQQLFTATKSGLLFGHYEFENVKDGSIQFLGANGKSTNLYAQNAFWQVTWTLNIFNHNNESKTLWSWTDLQSGIWGGNYVARSANGAIQFFVNKTDELEFRVKWACLVSNTILNADGKKIDEITSKTFSFDEFSIY